MADASASTSGSEITITIKGPSELKLSIPIDPSKTIGDLKDAVAAKSDVSKDSQRLIYSGKVLKDEETIASYKILTGHTVHMVKTNKPAAAAAPEQAPRLPQNMGTGLAAGNVVDGVENYHHGMAGFNPFQGMGVGNLNDPNAMMGLMDSPEFLRQMSDIMARPEVVDQIIASNPQLQAMGPQVRQMMQSPFFREMMSNPDTLRQMMQMQQAMGGRGGMGGMGGPGGAGGFGGFPGMFGAPGAGAGGAGAGGAGAADGPANLFAQAAGQTGGAVAAAPPAAPSAGTTGAAGGAAGANPAAAANPWASLFGAQGAGGAGGAGAFPPFGGMDPSMFFGGGGPFGAGAGAGAAAPRDTRPPEEIYETQLGQLSAMGLWDSAKNIRALRSTGGNVEAAIELLFSGQLDNPQ